jgi:nitrite reductase (NADH) small subunit
MKRIYTLGPIEQIPAGEGRAFVVGGREVAIFRNRFDQVYATQARCPHRQGPLVDGLVGGDTVICPLHAWKFNLASGAALMGDCAITAYEVALDRNGLIVLTMDEDVLERLEEPLEVAAAA